MNLIEIGKKYPSSKNISGFIELYQKYFSGYKDEKINLLEIGALTFKFSKLSINCLLIVKLYLICCI